MSSVEWEWEFGPKLPVYGKNARKRIKKSALYISLWDYLKNSVYVYTRHFHNWEIYILFIAHTFPNTDINDIKEDIDELLREFYIVHNRVAMNIYTHDTTNNVLNAFLEKLKREN